MKKLGFGLMRLPLGPSGEDKDIDKEKTKEMIDAFMAGGFNYFDTAYVYHRGMSEKIVGELISDRYDRSSFVLTTKMPVWLCETADDYEPLFQKQLERTRAGYFDYYFLHALEDRRVDQVEETHGFDFLKKKKEEGLVKHIGFSFHGTSQALEKLLIKHPDVELVQLQINYTDWEDPVIQARKCYELCRKAGVEVSIMEPIKGGSLANPPEKALQLMENAAPGKSPVDWAFRFAGTLPGILVVLSGMSNMQQLKENMKTFDEMKPLTAEEMAVLKHSAGLFNEDLAIKCTGCGYCTENCPQNIPIPSYFSLYNMKERHGYFPSQNNMYDGISKNKGLAGDCIQCGQCEAHCPQHLPIIENLKKISAVFDQK